MTRARTKATRTDVARRAGVSVATVSNTLNHPERVRPETVAEVRRAMEALDYRPNMVARSLITQRTMQLGIVLDDIRNPFYGEVVEKFEAAAEREGYFVYVCPGLTKIDSYFDNFISRGIDGAFVVALPHSFDVNKLSTLVDSGIRLVVSGSLDVDFRRISYIESNYRKAMSDAVAHLHSLGHTEIAYLSGLSREMNYDERCAGYLEALERVGIMSGDSLLFDGPYPYRTDSRSGYEQAKRLLKSGLPSTAVVCGNDLMAIGAIRAFEEAGLRVPKDISVVGFDGIEIGRYTSPPLTTMSVNNEAFGVKAFELLHNNMVNGVTGFYQNELVLVDSGSTAVRGGGTA